MVCFDKINENRSGLVFILLLLFTVEPIMAQRGFGTKTPSKAAIVEMKSGSRGLLIPRVALTDLSILAPIVGELPTVTDKVNSLLVFNTATVASEEISPGFYYWSTADQKWHRLLMDEDNPLEPWQVQGSTDKATQNTEPIYQMGAVAIGKNIVLNDGTNKAMLDVAGAIRGGNLPISGIIGVNSIAVGDGVIASGNNAVAMGKNTKATENFAVAFGQDTQAAGSYSFAAGKKTKATGFGAVALGYETEADGNYSMAMGYYAKANSRAETVFGAYNVNFSSVNSTGWTLSDPLFQIGNGTGTGDDDESNALTILKNGKIAIGMDGIDAIPTERLDVMQDKVRIRDLPVTIGTPSDRAVLVDATGRLKSLEAVAFIREPWLIQETSNPAISNQDDIYQTGRVAIGKDEAIPGAMLDVAGSISGGTPFGNATIGINSIAVGEKVEAIGKNTAAFGYSSEASAEGAFAGGGSDDNGDPGGNAFGISSFAFGHSATASGDYSVAMGKQTEASENYSVALGKDSEASDHYTFAMGSAAIASGNSSVAMGKATEASGEYSVAMGRHTIANFDYQTVFGKYNDTLLNANPEPIFIVGNGTSHTSRSNAITILEDGWVGIGYSEPSPSVPYAIMPDSTIVTGIPNEKLRVHGAILTSNYFYPDYVFEHYFDKSSRLNPNYRFMELDEIEAFIKKYRHLPGFLPASALNRTENGGYEFNVSRLSVKSLEKIEELYLHTFEQEAKIDRLQQQLDQLKREKKQFQKRLNQLEQLVETLVQETN